ncbi:hypothetical protein TNCV_3549531 [Trichonephila clavipes]|nr:hypothetical protein TNCV_3549531 [Trichonephila clavipes]
MTPRYFTVLDHGTGWFWMWIGGGFLVLRPAEKTASVFVGFMEIFHLLYQSSSSARCRCRNRFLRTRPPGATGAKWIDEDRTRAAGELVNYC